MRDVGEAVHEISDAPQDLPGAGEHGPADLMAVRGRDDAAGTCSARGRSQQRQGAAAPNQTVSIWCSLMSAAIFRAVAGVGSMTFVGQRTTVYGSWASKAWAAAAS